MFVFIFPYSFTYSWEILSMPMASTFTHKTDDFQICTSSSHLSPNLQIHTSSGLLDISTCLMHPMSQCQKLKLFSFCIPGQTYSSSSIVLCCNTIYSLKPETEQLFYSSSLLLLSFNTVRSSSEIFLKSLFSIPHCYCIEQKLVYYSTYMVVSSIAKAK